MARTEEYWEYDDGLIYFVKRTELAQKVRLHYEVVCPHCERRHNVFPYEASDWLERHFQTCPGRPRGQDAQAWDQWAIMRMLTGVFGYRRKRALDPDFAKAQRDALETRRSDYAKRFASAGETLADKNLDSHEIGPQRASEAVLSEANSCARRVKAIDDASERMSDSTYGVCADCQVDIGTDRLEALPDAVVCLLCAEKLSRG